MGDESYERRRVAVLDTEMAYIDTGSGNSIVFLHGNPTSSYLWRNVIPHLEGLGRCLAPDLVGMGDSGKMPSGSYRFVDQARYLDAWFDTLGIVENVTLVVHDWGSALGFYWAYRHRDRVKAIAYTESIVHAFVAVTEASGEIPKTIAALAIWQDMRSPAGEELCLRQNAMIERYLPLGTLRRLTEEEMTAYRHPYLEPGESRRPILTWIREVPLARMGPTHMVDIAESYGNWLATSDVPKLFINADPGAILVGPQREFCRRWANQQEVTVRGIHYVPEDSPHEIGLMVAGFLTEIERHL